MKNFLKKQFRDNNKEMIVFLHEDGSKFWSGLLTKNFNKKVKEMGKPKTGFHDLKHTHATWLLKLGVNPKIVQERLGHYDISTTLNIYSHVTKSMQKNAVKTLQKAKS